MYTKRKISLELPENIRLEITCFMKDDSIRYLFAHHYFEEEKVNSVKRHDVNYVNDQELFLRYEKGVLEECRLSMNIVFPKRQGKIIKYGMDLSKNSKISLQFYYEVKKTKVPKKEQDRMKVYLDDNLIELVLVGMSAGSKSFDFREKNDNQALIMPIELPFVVLDKIQYNFGSFSMPIQHIKPNVSFDFSYSIESS